MKNSISIMFEKGNQTTLFSQYDKHFFQIKHHKIIMNEDLYCVIDKDMYSTTRNHIRDCTNAIIHLPDETNERIICFHCTDLKSKPLAFINDKKNDDKSI